MMYVEQWMYGDIAHLAYKYFHKYVYSEIFIVFFYDNFIDIIEI